MVDSPALGRIAAPSLAHVASRYSNEELARAIRHGVRNDGTTLWIMPTQSYRFLADDDVGKVIGWIRTLEPGLGDSHAQTSFGPVGRALILAGKLSPSVQPGKVAEKTRPAETGRYFTESVCAGCHALDRELPAHDGNGMVPALAPVAAAYDLPAFQKLLRTGQGMTKRDLGLMAEVSRESFSAITPEEAAAIHAYLKGQSDKHAQ